MSGVADNAEIRTSIQDINTGHLAQIDLLKGLAIISVILLHTWPEKVLLITGAPLHIWQAVPVFILIAGFVGTLSYMRQDTTGFRHCYRFSSLFRRFKRILAPFTLLFIVQIVLLCFTGIKEITLQNIVSSYITGGYGPGSYFIPIILQHILILPILYLWAMRNPRYFLPTTFLISLVLEYLMIIAFVPEWAYRLLYVRYLFAGALGVWLAVSKQPIDKKLIIGALISLIYIFAVNYLNVQFWFLYPAWGSQHAPSYFWPLLIIMVGLIYLPSVSKNALSTALEKLGRASWHIFLVQMAFFWAFGGAVRSLFLGELVLPVALNISTILQMVPGFVLLTCFNLGVCLSLGCVFFDCEKMIAQRNFKGEHPDFPVS